MAVSLEPLLADPEPILDVVRLNGGQLLVLGTAGVEMRLPGVDRGARAAAAARVVPHAEPWPRDPRGRLRVAANAVEVFMPGVICRGTVDPLDFACKPGAEAWPIGVENTGIAAGRNYFTSTTLPPFLSIAPLNASGRTLLVAALDGAYTLTPAGLARLADAPDALDDVAAVASGCGAGYQVLAAGDPPGGAGAEQRLVAYEWRGAALVRVGAPALLPGRLAALWSAPGSATATAVVRNDEAQRYEAFLAGITCPH